MTDDQQDVKRFEESDVDIAKGHESESNVIENLKAWNQVSLTENNLFEFTKF